MTDFPKDFIWGTATASYQVEGAFNVDGRSESIWDRFTRTPGKVFEGHNGDVACDHYHRFKEDVKLMADLGIQSYRFSISWPRIFPEPNRLNPKGIDFYKRLLEELHRYHIQPVATIYHWDLPQWLQEQGGWVNRDTVNHFTHYAESLFKELGDQVSMWITHNEPWCAAFLGHAFGVHAPGHHDLKEALTVSHHLMLSHGKTVQAFRRSKRTGEIGITLNLTPAIAATDEKEDIEAAKRSDGFGNRWFLDPIFKGYYPSDMVKVFTEKEGDLDFIQTGDFEAISEPIDFLGVNYYFHNIVEEDSDDPLLGSRSLPVEGKQTEMGWGIHPESLYKLLHRLKEEYTELPLYITENGAAFPDQIIKGEIEDLDRIDYLKRHFDAAARFLHEGGNLKGYYVWSLLDNFEWAYGYEKRFGIVYVDYETLERIPKASAKWYKDLIEMQAPIR
ncbi:MAG TPA: GH1 family beta-glucosidase [Bacillales bacterium]|nr:GH1 family beta-glucosidase [Bacillales bacterium]